MKDDSSINLVDVYGDFSVFEDQYGELHDWINDSNIFHFLCRQLQLHYTKHVNKILSMHYIHITHTYTHSSIPQTRTTDSYNNE